MRRFLCASGVVAVALLALVPALILARDSVHGPDGPSLAAYAGVLREPRQWRLLVRSCAVAGGASLLALGWGTAVGLVVARLRGWRGIVLETLSYVPLLVPSLVVALGWTFFLGRARPLTRELATTLGLPGLLDLYTPAGAAFVLSLAYWPCVSVLAAQGFRALDPAALRAARMHAGPWPCLWRFWRPLLLPTLSSGALLVFLLAFADFGVPSALMVNVYPIEAFTQFSAFLDVKAAIASAAPALGVALAAFAARRWIAGPAPRAMPIAAGAPERSPRWAWVLAGLALAFSIALPLAFLLVTAGGDYLEALRIAGPEVLTSLRVSAVGAALCLAGAALFALAYRGLGRRGRDLAEAVILLPLVVPGTVVGLGILALVGAGTWPFARVYPAAEILSYAGFARYVTLPALVLAAGTSTLDPSLFAAARVHGASRARTAARILFPLAYPALVAATTLAFVLGLGELSAAVLVSPPGSMTLAVRLASLLHFGKDSIVAALCVVLAGLVAGVLVLGLLVAGAPLRLRLQHADRDP